MQTKRDHVKGRWQSSKTVLDYIEEGKLFEENVAQYVLEKNKDKNHFSIGLACDNMSAI